MTARVLTRPGSSEAEEEEKSGCVHHWVIDPPEGPVSNGICQKCGEERIFRNYVAYSPWEADSSYPAISGIGSNDESDSIETSERS